jgi:hypothetical protein
MTQEPPRNARVVTHADRGLTALASLAVGAGSFALWFWLLPGWLGSPRCTENSAQTATSIAGTCAAGGRGCEAGTDPGDSWRVGLHFFHRLFIFVHS